MSSVRTPHTPLSQSRILTAALDRIDREGLDRLSMRRLGRDLGVEAMSLYNYFASKEAMLDGVVALMLSEMRLPGPEISDWQARIKAIARCFRDIALRHPNAFPLFTARPVAAYASGRALAEATISTFVGAGFPVPDAIRAFRAFARYIVGFSMTDASSATTPEVVPEGLSIESPLVSGAVDDLTTTGTDSLFDFGIDLMVTGLAARLPR